MHDLGGPLLRGAPAGAGASPAACRAIRHPRGAGPLPLVLGTTGSHGTSAGISCPHCSFKELRMRRMRRMRRRQFIAGLGGAVAWPLAARAQQASLPVVAVINSGAGSPTFRAGLGGTGFVDGQNVSVENLFLEGQYDRLPALVADLVRRRVAVIVALSPAAAVAAKNATATIPIVFGVGNDPVKLGLVASLARQAATRQE